MRVFLARERLQSKALECGFIQRQGRLTAEDFLFMLLYCSSQEDSSSLKSMCNVLEDYCHIPFRKQSLDKRFGESCLTFVKSVLSELLEEQIQNASLYHGLVWENFSVVRVKDSTKFKVPDQMQEHFKGNGGSLSGICIQYEYDLRTGRILDLSVNSGGGNDRTEATRTCDIPRKGELVIRDLGYYSLEVFRKFTAGGVFFLSRLYPQTCVFQVKAQEMQEVDFGSLYRKMIAQGIKQIHMDVFVGVEHKIPLRMLLSLVDDQIYEKRVREREKENRKRGQKMSDKTRMRYHFSIYITNTTTIDLPDKQIHATYRLRWQIELIFKCWKSVYKIHLGKKMHQNRYLCMLYAKLILLVINLQLTRSLQTAIQKKDKQGRRKILSGYRLLFTLRKYFLQVYTTLVVEKKKAQKILMFLQQKISHDHWLEMKKRKGVACNINELLL